VSIDPTRRRRFEAVVAEVIDPLQRYLGRRADAADADDVLGDVLLAVWRRLDDVPADAPLPWCYGVARRCLANHRRGAARRSRLADRIGVVDPPEAMVDEHRAIDAMDGELVDAMRVLSPAEREIVYLWAWEHLEPREIAIVVDRTPNAVSVALTRARHKLADELRQSGDRAGQEPGARADDDHRGRR
jgi:RNA polymerase sigma-70 factor, ECF subfamily